MSCFTNIIKDTARGPKTAETLLTTLSTQYAQLAKAGIFEQQMAAVQPVVVKVKAKPAPTITIDSDDEEIDQALQALGDEDDGAEIDSDLQLEDFDGGATERPKNTRPQKSALPVISEEDELLANLDAMLGSSAAQPQAKSLAPQQQRSGKN